MKKIDKHILMPIDLDNELKIMSKENKITYTCLVVDLIRSAVKEKNKLQKIEDLESKLIYIKNKINLTLELLMQIYADMDFDNIKDIKNSTALKKFFRKRKDINYDD